MMANDDNSRIALFPKEESLPLPSEELNTKIIDYYILTLIQKEGKTRDEAMAIVRDSVWKDTVGYRFLASDVIDSVKAIDEEEKTHGLYRIVTTVDTTGYIMPADGLYYSNYFKTNDDYSKIIFFCPIEIPEDGDPKISVYNDTILSVTLKPVDGLVWAKTAFTMGIYSDEYFSECLWKGEGRYNLRSEGAVYVTNSNKIPFEEGKAYFYKIVNHDGFVIYEGSSVLTAINEINAESDNSGSTAAKYNGKKYNLAGQEVDSNYKGIVILNGAKYVQK